jgi:hypothetical protein
MALAVASKAQAKRALELYEKLLAGLPNVVGLGIVPAAEGEAGDSRESAVAVYVSRKVPAAKLAPRHLVPKVLEVPGKGGKRQVPTRVIEQGEVTLEGLGKEPP